jgi:hypothetical protein
MECVEPGLGSDYHTSIPIPCPDRFGLVLGFVGPTC